MSQNTHTVLSNREVRDHLSPDERQALIRLAVKVQTARQASGEPANYLVMRTDDPFARAAIEAYIAEAERWAERTSDATDREWIRTLSLRYRELLFQSRLNEPERLPEREA